MGNKVKTSKFMLCENPIINDSDDRQFILHNRDPFILAEIFNFESDNEREIHECLSRFSIGGKLDYSPETFVFGALWIFYNDKFTSMGAQEQADQLAGIMRRMADWYKSYLIWEDNQL